MSLPDNVDDIVANLRHAALSNKCGSKRVKVRTLMKKFGFKRRTEENTAEITLALRKGELLVNPSIMKLGEDWELSIEDWVVLSSPTDEDAPETQSYTHSDLPPEGWNTDGWFDLIAEKRLRTEKEVETKFVIPLLSRLGFSEDDRYDDMPVAASYGSRQTVLKVDFALFNSDYESLRNQVILTVEAKREERLTRSIDIEKARKQAKSYALWTGCYHCFVTDSRQIAVYKLARNHKEEDKLLFSCSRETLKDKFCELYQIISKNSLTRYYINQHSGADELI